jgi:hypothetical protein
MLPKQFLRHRRVIREFLEIGRPNDQLRVKLFELRAGSVPQMLRNVTAQRLWEINDNGSGLMIARQLADARPRHRAPNIQFDRVPGAIRSLDQGPDNCLTAPMAGVEHTA